MLRTEDDCWFIEMAVCSHTQLFFIMHDSKNTSELFLLYRLCFSIWLQGPFRQVEHWHVAFTHAGCLEHLLAPGVSSLHHSRQAFLPAGKACWWPAGNSSCPPLDSTKLPRCPPSPRTHEASPARSHAQVACLPVYQRPTHIEPQLVANQKSPCYMPVPW